MTVISGHQGKHQSLRGDQREREAQRELRERQTAISTAGPEGRDRLLPDGGEEADAGDDGFGTAQLREGETRDDDNVHELRNAQQMAIADAELGGVDDSREPLDVGDHVTDADSDGGPRMVVVVDTGDRADDEQRHVRQQVRDE